MTPASLSRTQIEKLGVRLVERASPAPEDLAALHGLLSAYGEVLDLAVNRVRDELDVAPTARIKNTGTILEKLNRHGGSWLKSLQDIAGMRIVGTFDRNGQDALVEQVVRLFGSETRTPKVIDRRAEPMLGYRAVHVVIFPASKPVEIQVRTELQHEWAELFEKLADRVGRGIRYGDPPVGRLPLKSAGMRIRRRYSSKPRFFWPNSSTTSKSDSRPSRPTSPLTTSRTSSLCSFRSSIT